MKIAKVEVTCPECGNRQMESASAISSYCRSCSAHLDLEKTEPEPEQVVYHVKVDRKRIVCRGCGHLNSVHLVDVASNCTHCGDSLDLQDYHLKREHAQLIDTHGKVVMEKRGTYHRKRFRARELETAGQMSGDLRADERLRVLTGGEVHAGRVESPEVVVEIGGSLQARRLVAQRVTVLGELRAESLLAEHVQVEAGGSLAAEQLTAPGVEVAIGGNLRTPRLVTRLEYGDRQELPSPPPAPSATADPPAG